MNNTLSSLCITVLTLTLFFATHSSVAKISGNRQVSNVEDIREGDPEFNHKYGALFYSKSESPLKYSRSSEYLKALVERPEANFALRKYADSRKSGFFGFFENKLSDAAFLNNRVFSKDKLYKQILDKGPTLRFLLGEPTGVREGYTVGEHASRLLDVYEEQKEIYFPEAKQAIYQIRDFDSFMTDLLVLHDIGKSIGYKANGGNSTETQYSTPFIGIFFNSMGYQQNEVVLAQSLIDAHKIIGDDYLKSPSKATLEKAVSKIKEAANKTHLNTSLYFDLLEMLFICDAGSYPGLQGRIFTKDRNTKKLTPKDQTAYSALVKELR